MGRIVLSGAMALVLSGCASTGVAVKQSQRLQFTAGQSTYADVVNALGNPISHVATRDGTREIMYTYAKATVRVESIIPSVGMYAVGADTYSTSVIFDFDKNGILTQFGSSAWATGTGMAAGKTEPRRAQPKAAD